MAADKALSWSYTEDFTPESEPARAARGRAAEFGVTAVSPGTGSVLRLLAAASGAHAVAEIGTGTGVSGVWLLEGMVDDGILTSIDVEAEYQRAAREAFVMAGVKPARTRLIAGRALDVLPRLADRAYDLVFVDGNPAEAPAIVEQAWRMLKPGGVLVVNDALSGGRVADPARRDELTVAIRELGKQVRSLEDAVPALLPSGEGLLVAVRR
ncbi:MAG: O-methyltransferase [Actinobacteria bacterium]|nr:O-methyltransferase [Actinomycetota bacterium]